MKKNGEDVDAEILKAVAQAWHGHSISTKGAAAASEFDAHRLYFKTKPSRFKVEAMTKLPASKKDEIRSWDFKQSLWDSYEIVSVSKKLERGLVMDKSFSALNEEEQRRRKKESKNSLRSLFNRMSSRRFTEADEFPSQAV